MIADPVRVLDRLAPPATWAATTDLDLDATAAALLDRVSSYAGDVVSLDHQRSRRGLAAGSQSSTTARPQRIAPAASTGSRFLGPTCKNSSTAGMSLVRNMMSSNPRTTATREPAGRPRDPVAEPTLFLIASEPPADSWSLGSRRLFEQLTRHILLARGLGLEPLTIDERAAAMLESACAGWRFDRNCCDAEGLVLDAPHPMCLRAQYHHDVLLLEHGLLNHEGTSQ